MSTPPQPSSTAARVISMESDSAQCPVPGIRLAAGTPPATSASSSFLFSETDIEFASLLVPNTARPAQPLFSSHLQCFTKRSASGDQSLRNGVTTGDSTPSMRFTFDIAGLFIGSSLLDFRAGALHDRRPALELGGDHGGHFLRRAGDDVVAELAHALDELGRLGGLVGGGVKAHDDVARRGGRHHQAEPHAGL